MSLQIATETAPYWRPKARRIEPMWVDLDQNLLRCGLHALRLTPQQAEILSVLAKRPRQLVHRETIIGAVWSMWEPEGAHRQVDVQMSHLRKLLRTVGWRIRTVYGTGFILEPMEG